MEREREESRLCLAQGINGQLLSGSGGRGAELGGVPGEAATRRRRWGRGYLATVGRGTSDDRVRRAGVAGHVGWESGGGARDVPRQRGSPEARWEGDSQSRRRPHDMFIAIDSSFCFRWDLSHLWFRMAMRWLTRAAMQRLAHQPTVRSFSSMMSAAPSEALPVAGFVVPCGRGDKKTKRGKRFKGSFGNARGKRKKMIQRIKDRVEVPRSTPWPLPFKLI
ncbi:hypothetical protein BHE74_00011564 [Ensete ventricosum]|nr:hypothetical protein BHE74_00011564 [Ensete ventricosum]